MSSTLEVKGVRDFTAAQWPAACDLLRTLVGVNSFTANRGGVLENARLIREAFAPLGFTAETVRSTTEAYGDHLFLTREGSGGGPTIALVGHLDTVFSPEEEQANDFHWRVEGDRAYGPGVNDIKGGTAMMWLVLTSLRRFAPDAFEKTRWLLAFNASEEVLSADFGAAALPRLGTRASAILVFEPGSPVDKRTATMVTARKGRISVRIECHGRASHSGTAHDKGANALVELCRVMSGLADQTDYANEVTWNPGVMHAGTVVNRVPHHAVGELEVRAYDPGRLAQARQVLEGLAGEGKVRAPHDGFVCRREVALTEVVAPWPGGEGTQRLVSRWEQAAAQVGRGIQPGPRGGLSDANFLAAAGVPMLDGMGPVGMNAHCSQRSADGAVVPEWVDLTSFAPIAAMHTLALAELLSDGAA